MLCPSSLSSFFLISRHIKPGIIDFQAIAQALIIQRGLKGFTRGAICCCSTAGKIPSSQSNLAYLANQHLEVLEQEHIFFSAAPSELNLSSPVSKVFSSHPYQQDSEGTECSTEAPGTFQEVILEGQRQRQMWDWCFECFFYLPPERKYSFFMLPLSLYFKQHTIFPE